MSERSRSPSGPPRWRRSLMGGGGSKTCATELVTPDRLARLGWDLIRYEPRPAHMHMALDEVLLQRVIAGARRPTVRFWEWIEPAPVIGSHQSVVNAVDLGPAHRLGVLGTRRMSGGGTMLCEPGRTITYSLYVPARIVDGLSFRQSYAALDAWAVRSFVALGVPASYREINDIISPRGKIAGAAQARRRGFVLHHTTIAHSMEPALLPRLIRIGRKRRWSGACAARKSQCRRLLGSHRWTAPGSPGIWSAPLSPISARRRAGSLLTSSKPRASWW